MQQKLNQLKEESLKKIQSLATEQEIVDYRNEIVGKSGSLTEILKGIKDLSVEEKQLIGKLSNDIKISILDAFEIRLKTIKKLQLELKLINDFFDVTIPSNEDKIHIHPITRILYDIYDTFERLGFEIIENYFSTPKLISDVISSKKSSFKSIVINKIIDGNNAKLQLDGIVVDKDLNLGNLKYLLKEIVSDLLGVHNEINFKPGLSDLGEIAVFVDFACPYCSGEDCKICNNSGKIELILAGLLNSSFIDSVDFDSRELRGLFFSFSLNRLAEIKYTICDSDYLFKPNLEFLRQF